MKQDNLWLRYTQEDRKEADGVCERYKRCLDQAKTERECVTLAVEMAEERGYKDLDSAVREGRAVRPGDRFYAVQMGKSAVFFQIGRKPLSEGMNILGAHIDSPRIDIKPNPLYEKDGFAYFDTHYYGGIKKYQ